MKAQQQIDEVLEVLHEEEQGSYSQPVLHQPFIEDEEEDSIEVMDDMELQQVLDSEISDARTYTEGELDTMRATALNYYYGNPRGDEVEGRSSVQSLDISSTIEAMLAQIMPSFVNGVTVEFKATSSADERKIQQENDYCANVVFNENNGYVMFFQLFKEAMLYRNFVCEITDEDYETSTVKYYENLDLVGVNKLLADVEASPLEILVQDHEENKNGTFNLKLRIVETKKKIVIEPVPLDEFMWDTNHQSIFLDNCGFTGRQYEVTESELIEQGYDPDVVRDLPTYSGDQSTSETKRVRSRDKDTVRDSHHRPTRLILLERVYMRVDYDGDGIAELRRIIRAGGTTILENEEFSHVPFVAGAPLLMPHEFDGISIFDKEKDIQDTKTAFLRKAVDNADRANNDRIGYVVGQANADDIVNSRPGGAIRLKRKDALVPVPHTDTLSGNLGLLGYMDQIRSERTGAALDLQTQGLPIQGDTAHGVERLVSSKEQLSSMIARLFAETGVKHIFLHVHRLLRMRGNSVINYQTSAGWFTTNPGMWPERENVSINIGLSMGERIRQQGAMERMYDRLLGLLEKGFDGIIVKPQGLFELLRDMSRVSGVNNPEKYLLDPMSDESMQNAQAKAQQAQAMQEQQMQMQNMMIQMQTQMTQMAEETKRMKATMDNQLGWAKLEENRRQHTEDTATKLTEIELKENENVPGSRV